MASNQTLKPGGTMIIRSLSSFGAWTRIEGWTLFLVLRELTMYKVFKFFN